MNLLTVLIYADDLIGINDTLNSIYKYADQIIVITNDYQSDIIYHKDIEFFIIDRNTNKIDNLNKAIKSNRSKWILYLNSGEILNPKSSSNIRELISAINEQCGGFLCCVTNSHVLTDSRSSKGFYPRLFKYNSSINDFFKGILLEQTSFSIIESGKTIFPSDLLIIVNKSVHSLNAFDNVKYLVQLSENNQNEFYWYELGLNYSLIGDLRKSEEAFVKVMDFNCNFHVKELASLALSNLCRRNNRFPEAVLWAEIAYEISKDKVASLQALANAHLWNQDLDNAKKFFIELENQVNIGSYKYYNIKFPKIIIDNGLEEISKMESILKDNL